MNTRQATTDEIRGHFFREGHDVRISREGRVTFKRNGRGAWLEGRWVSEYRVDDDSDDRAYLTVRLT